MKNTVSVVVVLLVLLNCASARYGWSIASLNTQSALASAWDQYKTRFVIIRAQDVSQVGFGLDPKKFFNIINSLSVNSNLAIKYRYEVYTYIEVVPTTSYRVILKQLTNAQFENINGTFFKIQTNLDNLALSWDANTHLQNQRYL